MEALGIVEVVGMASATVTLDKMIKGSNVKIKTLEKKLGGRLVTLIVSGSVGDVKEAVNIGYITGNSITKCVAHAVILKPHEELIRILEKSREKYKGL